MNENQVYKMCYCRRFMEIKFHFSAWQYAHLHLHFGWLAHAFSNYKAEYSVWFYKDQRFGGPKLLLYSWSLFFSFFLLFLVYLFLLDTYKRKTKWKCYFVTLELIKILCFRKYRNFGLISKKTLESGPYFVQSQHGWSLNT